MVIPIPPAPPPPAQVLELPVDAPEMQDVGILNGGRTNDILEMSRIEPDPLPEKPKTAEEVVNFLYQRGTLKDYGKKENLLSELVKIEKLEEDFPTIFLSSVIGLERTKALKGEQIQELILDLGPAVTMKVSSLIRASFIKEKNKTNRESASFQLSQNATRVLEFFSSLEPHQRSEYLDLQVASS